MYRKKKKTLKATSEEEQVTLRGRPIRITPDLSMETLSARRAWTDVLQTIEDCRCQPTLLYRTKFSVTINEENKTSHNKIKFKQYLYTNQVL